MIDLRIEEDKIIASYFTDTAIGWLIEKFNQRKKYAFHKTFTFGKEDLLAPNKFPEAEIVKGMLFNEEESIDFIFANLENEYYKVKKGVLCDKINIYIHRDVEIKNSLFIVDNNVSIFKEVEKLIDEDVYIGGNKENSISESDYLDLIHNFPTYREKKLYIQAKISNLIKEFFTTTIDGEQKLQNYLNKKKSYKGENLKKIFKNVELYKYETILDKLQRMLCDENNYNETTWQEEILNIILLLYPKYIQVFKEVQIKADYIRERRLDFLLVDSNGNVDIIEIKKPFENAIITQREYRNNYIPLRELSGTVMQMEKYIYYLNRWGEKGEKFLTDKYKDKLPDKINIKITNPSGIIIMGRENELTKEQKQDFEVVKRKYKNIVDIITYDNLIERLKYTITQINCI